MTLTQDRRTALIGGCPLFQGLDATGLGALAGAAVEVDFPADRVIARQGEIGTGFFVVIDGMVRVSRDGTVVARLGPGEFFGELSVLDGRRAASRSRPGTSNASCENSRGSRCRCCAWSPGDCARCRRTAGPSASDPGM